MKSLTKIGYYIFLSLVGFIAIFLVVTFFPITGNFQVKIVQSGSMEPAIKTGSIVVIKPQSNYTAGDIVTFGKDTKDSVPTTHRIINSRAVEGRLLFTTKGDANEDSDPIELPESEVMGKVLFSVPTLGYLLDFARKPVGFGLLIGVPAAVIIFDEIVKIWQEVARIREEKRKNETKENEA